LEAGIVPLVLGGDHSVAAGTVAGVAEFYRRQSQKIGLIWIDAHTDINTPETSPSGNVHGMPLAAIMGLGPPELANIFNFCPKVSSDNCVLVGVRDIDAIERENVHRAGIKVFTMRDIDERGMRTVMEETLRAAGRGTAGYHVSLDMDWVVRPAWALRCVAEQLTARLTSLWKSSLTMDACPASRSWK
jgi:arginase